MKSLEKRLQIGLAVSVSLMVGILWFLGHQSLHRMMETFILSRLQHDTEAILATFQAGEDGSPKIGRRRLTPVYNQPFSGHYYLLETKNGERILSRSLWDQDLEIPMLQPGESSQWHMPGPRGQTLLVWAAGYQKAGHEFTLTIAEDVSPLENKLVHFEWLFAGIAAGGLALLLAIQRIVIHRGFRRLEPVFADMRRLEQGETVRLTEDVPSEIYPLVHKFNGLLNVLHERLERSRNALGNLAHALKTPLSLMVQQVEGPELHDRPQLRASLDLQTRRIQALMERELKRARMAGSGNPGQLFDPREEIPSLVEVIKRTYVNKQLEVLFLLEGARQHNADREDMLELLGNLLDNAFKWAKTRVRCTVQKVDEGIEYCVEDDGPGCDPSELQEIQQRGVRLDETVAGHGLGLAIVKDIVRIYGAELILDRSPELLGLRARALFRRG